MNLPIYIAKRYLFAKRSTNAINIITGISIFGVSIGTAALILVMSVFNGFEDLLAGLFGNFNPEIKVEIAKGKTFETDSLLMLKIKEIPGISVVSETLEEIAFFEYQGSQDFGVLKGIDNQFSKVTYIDTTIEEGSFALKFDDDRNGVILGSGMRNKLSVNVNNPLATLTIFMPDKDGGGALDKPFKTRLAYPTGTFSIQQEFDNQYILTNIDFARELLGVAPRTVSALEIKCTHTTDIPKVKKQLVQILGSDYNVKDHYEQNEAFFKVMQLEKWMGFAITSLMLVLMAFNTIGALWMIVLDKQKDISMLKSMGATDQTVRRVFLLEGMLLTLFGMLIGIALALLLYFLQKNYGLISIPDGFLVSSYPIAMRTTDFIPIVVTILGIGFLASLLPARRAAQVPAFLREE